MSDTARQVTQDIGALSVEQFCERYGLGRSTVYRMIAASELRAVKAGQRTIILAKDIRAWERSLEPLH